jgi:xylulokinase
MGPSLGLKPARDGAVWVGLDIGTSAVRASAHSLDGRRVAEARAVRPPRAPVPGAMVHDPDADWWSGACEAARALTGALGERPVAGVGLATLFPAFCLVDGDDAPRSEGLLYGDTRARDLVAVAADLVGRSVRDDEVTPRLLWLGASRSGLFDRPCRLASPSGFVGLRLTGALGCDPHSAVRWGGIAVDGAGWDLEAAGRLGIPERWLPPIRRPTDVLGRVTSDAAAATGLAEGTPVVMGTTDSFCQLLGDGVRRPGDAMVSYGSSGTLLVPTVDLADAAVEPSLFGADAPYRLAVYLVSCGTFLDLVRARLMGGAGVAELDDLAAMVSPGAEGLLAYPWLSEGAGGFVGLGLGHGRGHVWRAALESFGYLLAEARDGLGRSLDRVVASGGGARSLVWRTIVSHQTGWAQVPSAGGATTRGAALLAAAGIGALGMASASDAGWRGDPAADEPTRPDPGPAAAYARLAPAWRAGATALAATT